MPELTLQEDSTARPEPADLSPADGLRNAEIQETTRDGEGGRTSVAVKSGLVQRLMRSLVLVTATIGAVPEPVSAQLPPERPVASKDDVVKTLAILEAEKKHDEAKVRLTKASSEVDNLKKIISDAQMTVRALEEAKVALTKAENELKIAKEALIKAEGEALAAKQALVAEVALGAAADVDKVKKLAKSSTTADEHEEKTKALWNTANTLEAAARAKVGQLTVPAANAALAKAEAEGKLLAATDKKDEAATAVADAQTALNVEISKENRMRVVEAGLKEKPSGKEVQANIDAARKALEDQVNGLTQRVEKIEGNAQKFDERLGKAEGRIQTLEQRVNALHTSVDKLKSFFGTQRLRLSKDEAQTLADRLNVLERIHGLDKKAPDAVAIKSLTDMQKELTALQEQVAKNTQKIGEKADKGTYSLQQVEYNGRIWFEVKLDKPLLK